MAPRDYRFYLINSAGQIAEALDERCDGDDAAIFHAAKLLSGRPDYRTIDVWTETRRVAQLGAEHVEAVLEDEERRRSP
jgi:hypothetical protein